MPRPDPVPTPPHAMLLRFRRIMKWLAFFSIVVAAIAVLLVAQGDEGDHVHMLIATALGAGMTVLLGGGLMSLAVLTSSSGHGEEAGEFDEEDQRL